jgi:transcriptional regulator with XRE-family HTH domain
MYILRTSFVSPSREALETALTIFGISHEQNPEMPKKLNERTMSFGARLATLRKAAGFTQAELAEAIGMSRRMVAYYEVESDHPPTTVLPAIAQALNVTTDELLGAAPVKKAAKTKDSRLQRRLAQIEKLEAAERRQVLQLIDAFIERGQLKRKVAAKQPA